MVTSAKEISDLAHGIDVHSSGNVGIGTTNPLVKLDLGVTSPNDQVIALRQNGVSRTTLGLTNNYGVRVAGPSDASATGAIFEVGQNNASDGTTYQNTKLSVLYNGNVGIGYTSPNEKLHVNGYIEASSGFKLASHPILDYTGFDGGYSTRLGSTGTSTLNATQIFAGGSVQATFKGGKVGIGTTGPDGILNVVSTAHNNGAIFDSTGTAQIWLRDTNATSNQRNWGFQISGGDFNIVRANDDRASGFVTPIYIQQAPNNSLVIDSSGKVSIGGNIELNGGGTVSSNGASDTVVLSGSTAVNLGGNITLHGQSHANASQIFFKNGSTNVMAVASGKVLVGTTSNNYNRGKFTVFGNPGNPATTGTNSDNVAIRVATNAGNSQAMDIGIYNAAPYGAWLQASNSGSLQSFSPIILNPNGGSIGIGTTAPLTILMAEDTGGNLTSGNAIKSSTMKGLSLNAQEGNAHTNSLGVWFGSNGSHWSGIAGGRSNTSTWGTDLRFYTHEDNTADLTYARERMVITESGNVGIGTQVPAAKLDVSGGVFQSPSNAGTTVTGASSTVHNLVNRSKISGKINIPFEVFFANGTSNLCIRLYYSGSSLWTGGEVLLGATYSSAGAMGFRRYSFGHNYNSANNYGNYISNTENMGVTSSHFSFHDHGWDSSETAHYFEFRHLASSGNTLWIQFQCFGSALSTAFSGNWYYKHKTF